MKIDDQTIYHIADLAALKIESQKLEQLKSDMNEILHFVEQIDQQNTQHIHPMTHPLDMTQRLREDKIMADQTQRSFGQLSPYFTDGYYTVPKVVE